MAMHHQGTLAPAPFGHLGRRDLRSIERGRLAGG